MPKHDRMQYPAIAGALAVALITGLIAGLFVDRYLWQSQDAQSEHRPWIAYGGEAVERAPNGEAQSRQDVAPRWRRPSTLDEAERIAQTSCTKGKDCRAEQREYSDLHAQWKAAEAAEGQYSLAVWATFLGILGTGIACIGTLLLIWTFLETRRTADAAHDGVIEARRAATAAEEGAKFTRDVGISQLRAYLGIERCSWTRIFGEIDAIEIIIKNYGNTPAKNVIVSCKYYVALLSDPADFTSDEVSDDAVFIHAGCDIRFIMSCTEGPNPNRIEEDPFSRTFAIGRVDYVDIFGINQNIRFHFIWKPEFRERMGFVQCATGNHAT